MTETEVKNISRDILELGDLLLKERPQKSDAIVWLQGDRFDRGLKTLELFNNGWAPKIIISGNDELIGPGKRPGENNVSLQEMKQWLLERGLNNKDIIVENQSFNTRDQALNVLNLVKKNEWKQIIIVGSMPHYQARYFLTFLKAAEELSWGGKIINQFVMIADNKKPGGRKKVAKELMANEFKKIDEYQVKGHVAGIETGISYLTQG